MTIAIDKRQNCEKCNNNSHKRNHLSKKHKRKISNNAKINSNYGMKNKHLSRKTKKRISESVKIAMQDLEIKRRHILSQRGKKMPKSFKLKQSKLTQGKNNPMYGKHHTNESKLKISTSKKGKKYPIELYPNHGVRGFIMSFKSKDTSIELKLQNLLKELNISFTAQKLIIGQPDIFINPNVCIFADGCYWHKCEKCFDKNKFTEKDRLKQVYDIAITQKLINKGYKVLRLWEHEIRKMNIKELKEKIFMTLNSQIQGVKMQ